MYTTKQTCLLFLSVNCVYMYVKMINGLLKCAITFEDMFRMQEQRSFLHHCDQAGYLQLQQCSFLFGR